MNELIKVTTRPSGLKAVSAKDLYMGLGMNKAVWARWYPTNIQNNEFFLENEDWVGLNMMLNGNESMDFAISIDFAKHIAMQARTPKSHEYRNYFLECERVAIAKTPLQEYLEMSEEDKAIAYFNNIKEKKQLQLESEVNKPKVEAFETFIETNNLLEWDTVAKNLGIGKNTLLRKLREIKILQTDTYIYNGKTFNAEKHNVPYQSHMKYFDVKYVVKNNMRYPKVLVSAMGQEYLRKKLKSLVEISVA